MTSNTATDGTKLTWSAYNGSYYPWYVTNFPEGEGNKSWEAAGTSAWIQFEFTYNARFQTLIVYGPMLATQTNGFNTPMSVTGYTASGSSTVLGSGTFPKGAKNWTLVINNNNAFKSIRIQISGALHVNGSYINVRYIELFGWKLS
jgi:hypothetical protein